MPVAASLLGAIAAAAALAACGGDGERGQRAVTDKARATTETKPQGPTEAEIRSEAEAIMRHRQEFERVGKRLGRVRPGMGKSEVRSKAGRPDDVKMGMVSGKTVECWRYMKLPPTDPAERFARVFRVCFRAGKVTEMRTTRASAAGAQNDRSSSA